MKELKELENAIKETIVYKNKTLAQWEAIARNQSKKRTRYPRRMIGDD